MKMSNRLLRRSATVVFIGRPGRAQRRECATRRTNYKRQGRYYVAVGDSISYGFQTAKAVAGQPPRAFDTGYVDFVAARLRRQQRDLRVVNFACPGESSDLDHPTV